MYCSITLVGRVSNELTLKYLQNSGVAVCELDMAVDRGESSKNEKITDFYTIQVWGKYGETISSILEKGQIILVEGISKFEKWKDEKNISHTKFKIKSDKIKFINYINNTTNFEEVVNEYNVFDEEN